MARDKQKLENTEKVGAPRKGVKKDKLPKKTPAPGGLLKNQPTEKKRKYLPGTVSLREIRKQQKSTKMLSANAPFKRLVRYVVFTLIERFSKIHPNIKKINFKPSSMRMLQSTAEDFTITLAAKATKCSIHAKRVTLTDKDIHLVGEMETMML